MLKKIMFFAAIAALNASGAFATITYKGQFATTNIFQGSELATASYSITTNGTIGALSYDDFVSADITLTAGFLSNFVVSNPSFYFGGASATSTHLFFDFGPTSYLTFSTLGFDLCFNGGNGNCFGEPYPSTSIKFSWNNVNFLSYSYQERPVGLTVIGSAVPEPETWSMMIGGLALVGAMRRRRSVNVGDSALN